MPHSFPKNANEWGTRLSRAPRGVKRSRTVAAVREGPFSKSARRGAPHFSSCLRHNAGYTRRRWWPPARSGAQDRPTHAGERFFKKKPCSISGASAASRRQWRSCLCREIGQAGQGGAHGRKIAFVVIGNQQWPTLRRYVEREASGYLCPSSRKWRRMVASLLAGAVTSSGPG